jgi:F-type H+-transporting ATPase subunit b
MQNAKCKMQNVKIFIIPLLILFLQIFVSVAIASGGEGEHDIKWTGWLWKIINFGILVFLLYYVVTKFRLKEVLTKRSEGIAKAIRDAEEAKEKARQGLEAIQDRLMEKDKEVEAILNAAKVDGEKEKASLIEEGGRIGEGLVRQAKENIEQEMRKAKESLREEAVNLALELAEGKIKENLRKEDEERILKEYLKKMGDGNDR